MNLMMPREEDYTRCRACSARFSVARGPDRWPPGRALACAGLPAVLSLFAGYATWFLQSWPHALLAVALADAAIYFFVLAVCHRARCQHEGGGICPTCGTENKVRLSAI
jgi:hypothetical protein